MSYATTILADSPVSYWKLDEASGTTATDGADSNNGTYTGTFTLSQAAPGPSMTGGVLLNGSNGFITIPTAANLNFTGDYTLEAWFKTTTTSASTILGKAISSSPFSGYAIELTSSGLVQCWVGDNTFGYVREGKAFNDGNWHHVACVLSGTTANIYVDTALLVSSTVSPIRSSTNALTIGRDSSSASKFLNGTVSNVAVYSAALTLNQLQAHFNAAGAPTNIRLTQEPVRTLLLPSDNKVRLTQEMVRTLVTPSDNKVRLTQGAVRTLVLPSDNKVRLTQGAVRTLVLPSDNKVRVTQMAVRVLRINAVPPPNPAIMLSHL